jgi:hypothetical protein
MTDLAETIDATLAKTGTAGVRTRADKRRNRRVLKMGRLAGALYAVAMAAVIVGVDLVFFRNRFWERLMANIGIVLVFAAFYLRFFRPP